MKTAKIITALFSSMFIAIHVQAQGSLTPPGAPAPMMKTLDQVEPRTPISALPYTITQPGSYYFTTNLTGGASGGITISASGVTLDLMGFELVGGTGSGIAESGILTNIVVCNGTVRGWSLSGVFLNNARGSRLERLAVSSNAFYGILTGKGSTITDCMAWGNNPDGIVAHEGSTIRDCTAAFSIGEGFNGYSGCTFSGCTANQNGTHGFAAANCCVLIGCSANDNGGDGIRANTSVTVKDCTALNNTLKGINAGPAGAVSGCTAYYNLGGGILVGIGGTVSGCTAYENSFDGIVAEVGSTVTDCTAGYNSTNGISATTSCTISRCTAKGNLRNGIAAQDGCSISGCTVRGNGVDGVAATYACMVRDCTAAENGNDGIQVASSGFVTGNDCYNHGPGASDGAGIHATGNNNRIEGNNVSFGDRGIDVGGYDNLIIRNSVTASTIKYSIAANNKVGAIIAAPNSGAISGSTGGSGVGSTDPWANISY